MPIGYDFRLDAVGGRILRMVQKTGTGEPENRPGDSGLNLGYNLSFWYVLWNGLAASRGHRSAFLIGCREFQSLSELLTLCVSLAASSDFTMAFSHEF
jgi:hypothetical protein